MVRKTRDELYADIKRYNKTHCISAPSRWSKQKMADTLYSKNVSIHRDRPHPAAPKPETPLLKRVPFPIRKTRPKTKVKKTMTPRAKAVARKRKMKSNTP